MSFLTTLPRDRYDPHAFDQFDASRGDFHPGNAKAMAWACQFAYETEDAGKVASIASDWSLGIPSGGIVIEPVATILPVSDTRVIFGVRDDAAVVSFAGTDPLSLANWITNFDLRKSSEGSARGFAAAAQSVWERIDELSRSSAANLPVFVTGHSLGAALAVLTAQKLHLARPGSVRAVYAFGMPRVGDAAFAAAYDQALGSCTYRCVHGRDVVPTVPPSELGARHVGRLLHCPPLGRFEAGALQPVGGSDDPKFTAGVSATIRELQLGPLSAMMSVGARYKLAAALALGVGPAGLRTDPGGIAIELLPPPLRDHIPDRYIGATG